MDIYTLTPGALNELERAAYARGDIDTANLLARIAELESENEALQNQIDDTVTLADWEQKNGSAKAYYDFFRECFDCLNEHYPVPSIESDYDKSVIFDAIRKGEAA